MFNKIIASGAYRFVAGILISGLILLSFSPESRSVSANFAAGNPEPYNFYKLDFKVQQPVARPDLEAEMLRMVNQERLKNGLKALTLDTAMTKVARLHSKDMFARGYFSHYTPEKVSPYDRMEQAKITYIRAGENISLGPTLILSHNGLMNSPGHRANILKPNFGRLGIGIMDGGRYGLMITQDFRN